MRKKKKEWNEFHMRRNNTQIKIDWIPTRNRQPERLELGVTFIKGKK